MFEIFRYNTVVGTGETLKDACIDWFCVGCCFNYDNFMNKLKKSKFWNRKCNKDIEAQNEAINNFTDHLSGKELFEILKENNIHYYKKY